MPYQDVDAAYDKLFEKNWCVDMVKTGEAIDRIHAMWHSRDAEIESYRMSKITAPTSPVDAEPVGYFNLDQYGKWTGFKSAEDARIFGGCGATCKPLYDHPAPAVEGKEKYTRIGWALRFLPPHDCDIYFGLDQNEQRIREWCDASNKEDNPAKTEAVPVFAAMLAATDTEVGK